MSEPIVIKLEGGTAGHASVTEWAPDDEAWIKGLSDSEKSVRVRIPAGSDTEGHVASATVDVVVSTDDDDTEGHAISIHFPSVKEANDFRRRVTAAGLITATIAVGAAGGAALGMAAGDSASGALSSGTTAEMQQQHLQTEYGATSAGTTSDMQQQHLETEYGAAATGAGTTSEMQQQHLQTEYGAQAGAAGVTRTGPLGDGMGVGTPTQTGAEADAFAGHTQYDGGTGATPQGSADDEGDPPAIRGRNAPR
jgi:hypothetical protein